MRFRKCVGSLLLMGLLAACGGRASEGGFHPSGGQAPADGSSTGPSAGAGGASGSTGDGSAGAGGPAPKTPQSAMAAYRDFQLAYEAAYENNDVSALSAVAMDPLLAKISQDINKVRSQGIIWRFHSVLNPQVQGGSADGSSVVILDCVKTLGSFKFDAKTGRRIGSWRGGTAEYQAIMSYADGIWKISDATEGGKC
jgi:hypothetical protein